MKDAVYKKIRITRKARQMSLKDMSEKTGLSQSFISQVERGKCDLTLMSMVRIAKALNVDMKELFELEDESTIVSGNEIALQPSDYLSTVRGRKTFKKISSNEWDRKFDAVVVTCEPNSVSEASSHDGEELIYVLEGGLHILIGDEMHFLKKGQAIQYKSSEIHQLFNKQGVELKYLIVVTELIE